MTFIVRKCLFKKYNISIKFFTAHYAETNGQTESADKVMKNYLCTYINHI